ncbi:hypothetical protein M514_27817 [Trichuris suis]|uniref:Uncharacterized protein n=1 Tax=Trichuris suis TaxID=68888 RepID=A0A085MS00_9BILA|nr:hypothetical protein M514_27817 [Trichuris suis]
MASGFGCPSKCFPTQPVAHADEDPGYGRENGRSTSSTWLDTTANLDPLQRALRLNLGLKFGLTFRKGRIRQPTKRTYHNPPPSYCTFANYLFSAYLGLKLNIRIIFRLRVT